MRGLHQYWEALIASCLQRAEIKARPLPPGDRLSGPFLQGKYCSLFQRQLSTALYPAKLFILQLWVFFFKLPPEWPHSLNRKPHSSSRALPNETWIPLGPHDVKQNGSLSNPNMCGAFSRSCSHQYPTQAKDAQTVPAQLFLKSPTSTEAHRQERVCAQRERHTRSHTQPHT